MRYLFTSAEAVTYNTCIYLHVSFYAISCVFTEQWSWHTFISTPVNY